MKEGDRVRVVKVSDRPRAKVGPDVPRVGDVGIVRHVVRDSRGKVSGYVVEHARASGRFSWTADFLADEVMAVA